MVYIFIAMLFYAVALVFGTAAARNLNTNLAAAVTNVLSAVIPLAVALPLLSKKDIQNHTFGLLMSVAGGVCIAIFALALTKSFSLNKVGVVVPIVFGGAIFLSTILGSIIFKEKVTTLEIVGLIALAIGFGLITYARATVK